MSTVLLDDHLLLRILLADEPASLRPTGAALATTGLWYHRLCRALADDTVIGSMSRQLGNVDDTIAAEVLGAVIDLPDTIEVVSLRTLGWPMGSLAREGLHVLGSLGFAVNRNEYLPIPQQEIDLTQGNLKQNPGY